MSLYYIPLGSATNLTDWLSQWPSGLQNVELIGLNLTDFPHELGRFTNLSRLKISENHIRVLPSSIGQFKSLTALFAQGNALQSIPHEITDTPLTMTYLGANNISSIESLPWSFTELKQSYEQRKLVGLQGNPICNHPAIQDFAICTLGCSSLCHVAIAGDLWCHEACNTTECDHDGGDCLRE